ncbi:hypothetical protein [Halalkalibacterium ligniniphilum]|uniref:hypothetical protein n=1 Tax=Halalkalibacterium ligniniphilum TaxID=1134413 RepID=UPI00034795A7|nr:hypothetical protein [Halalkalibacterium ligniniphilum]
MDKSQLLDELRLEVGTVPDFANTLTDFYNGIVQKLARPMETNFAVSIYEAGESAFYRIASVGLAPFSFKVQFGKGLLSLTAIRGKLQIVQNQYRQTVVSPYYEGHHLIGQLVVSIPIAEYVISEEDVIFLKEVTRFIEVNKKRYQALL